MFAYSTKSHIFDNWNHIFYYYFTHGVQSCLQHTNKPQRNTIIIFKKKMSEQKEEMEEVEVIHSWSAPRSLSTCLMYSFAQVGLVCFSLTFLLFFQIHSLLGCLERKSMQCFFVVELEAGFSLMGFRFRPSLNCPTCFLGVGFPCALDNWVWLCFEFDCVCFFSVT